MFQSAIAHVSLLAVLVHLHGDGCAYHLPACQQQAAAHCQHGHGHGPADDAPSPADLPPHDDCHESHAAAAVAQAVSAPALDAEGSLAMPVVAAVEGFAPQTCTAMTIGRADETCPLPLRAFPRSQVLLN